MTLTNVIRRSARWCWWMVILHVAVAHSAPVTKEPVSADSAPAPSVSAESAPSETGSHGAGLPDSGPANAVTPQVPYAAQLRAPIILRNRDKQDDDDTPVEVGESPWPKTLPYLDGAPQPPGYRLEESKMKGLIIGGIVPLSALYLISLTVASENNYHGTAGWLALPVAGPYAWLIDDHSRHSCATGYCGSDNSAERGLVVFDAMVQTAGAAMFITGLAVTCKQWVLANPAELYVAPFASTSMRGISAVGRF